MPGRPSEPGTNAIVPSNSGFFDPVVYPLRHGLKPPILRVYISWSRGNILHVSCLGQSHSNQSTDVDEESPGGKVLEVKAGGGDRDIDNAEWRRIAYGSVPAFAVLQGHKNSASLMARMAASPAQTEWWQNISDYSDHIKALLGQPNHPPDAVIEDPLMVLKPPEEPTDLMAAWQLMDIFYANKQSLTWLPERLVDWLADYDILLSKTSCTVYTKLLLLQKKLVNLQIVEDDPLYWEGLSSATAVGWLDVVVKLLRLHSSYQPDQLDNRETENGLVEAVAVLVSTMPRMRPDIPFGKLGQCHKRKPDFIKAWEKWRGHIAKLDCSAFWVQCTNRQTREGLKNLLQIMLGNINNLASSTHHWMELYISHFLYLRPLTVGLDEMYNLVQKCLQMKPESEPSSLVGLLHGILGENTEVVLAECSRTFGPWMAAHAAELLAASNIEAESLMREERYNLGGISIEELNRLIYSQVLSSHALTWQIAPSYLASCPKQGLGLLEILLYRQPVQRHQMLLKDLEICRLYELENISSSVMKIAGVRQWKHGRKGFGIYWLQQARDEFRLNKIAQTLFDSIGKSISDDSFKQWEGLIELLGSQVGGSGGLEFLHRYRDFKRSLKQAQLGNAADARKSVEFLMQLMKSTSTPVRFWLPLLHDSIMLLNWPERPLLNVSETHLLLIKLQELSLAKLRPDFQDAAALTPQVLSSVRLALGQNLGRAILDDH